MENENNEPNKLFCIVCEKELKNYMLDGVQPSEGVCFNTSGHYGSTVFDPMNASKLEICVCDKCLLDKSQKSGTVWFNTSVVYTENNVVPWDPKKHD